MCYFMFKLLRKQKKVNTLGPVLYQENIVALPQRTTIYNKKARDKKQ